MRLNVEISASNGNWNEDKLRRAMKVALTEAINDVINELPYSELHSLKFVKPAPRKRKAAS